jgi:hypothetical protein
VHLLVEFTEKHPNNCLTRTPATFKLEEFPFTVQCLALAELVQ